MSFRHSLKPQLPSLSKNGTIFIFTPQTAGHRRMATRSGLSNPQGCTQKQPVTPNWIRRTAIGTLHLMVPIQHSAKNKAGVTLFMAWSFICSTDYFAIF
jgi:hypothetical protein